MEGRPSGAGSRLRQRLILALGFVLVGLLAGEGLVRLSGRAPRIKRLGLAGGDSAYERSTNPILGFELKRNYRNERADFSRTYPRTNSHGQRDRERSLEKLPGVRRVILLGDSVVEGHGIREIEQTLSRQLEQLMEREDTEVLNFGVSGYCTRAEVELLAAKGLAFDPDVVIVVFVSNDFDNFNREAFELGATRQRSALIRVLFTRSQLFRLLALQLDLFGLAAEHDPVRWNRRVMGDNNVADGFRLLRELADERGFQPLVAVWPVFDDARVLDAHLMPEGHELVVERLAAAAGLPSARLSTFFESDRVSRDAPFNPRLMYTTGDGLHPSPEGCRVGARALRDLLHNATRALPEPQRAKPLSRLAEGVARELGSSEPGYAHVHNNRGVTLQQEGRLDEAIRAFRLAIESDPDFAGARNNLANALLRRGELNEALELYRRALELQPDQPDVHYNIGLVLEQQGQLDEARSHFRNALRLRPGFPEARQRLETLD